MKIRVRVKPYSRKNELKITGDNEFVAQINQPPSEGRANKALIELISDYFGVPKSAVQIITGHKSKNKIVEIAK